MRAASAVVAASLALAAATCDPDTDADEQEVKNGTSGAAFVNRVFYLINAVAPDAIGGSSSNVKYKRCVLTAQHVVKAPGVFTPLSILIYQGANLSNLDGKPYQNVARFEVIPGAAVPRRDLALLWATNYLSAPGGGGGGGGSGSGSGTGGGGGGGEIRIPLSGWAPYPVIKTIGLGNAQQLADGTGDPAAPSTGAPVNVMIAGYGNNTTVAGADTGSDILRVGEMNATHYFDSTVQTAVPAATGGFYYLVQKASSQSVCLGDSGGPAGTGSGIFGVISTQVGATCATSVASQVTALNDAAVGADKSNWDWVHEAIARICGKTLSVQIFGEGRVDGTISPGQNHTQSDLLSNKIRCDDDGIHTDCIEMFHETQAMTLTATPDAGWRFRQWHAIAPHRCACAGSTAPTCAVAYDPMGTYTPTVSDDDDGCIAEFEPLPPPPDGGVPDAPLPDGGLPDGGPPDGGLPDAPAPDAPLPDGGPPADARTDASPADGPGGPG